MEIKRATIPFDIKGMTDPDDDSGDFKGYGSIFGNIDLGGDIVERGAFSASLERWQAKGEYPQMLGFHRDGNVIGDWTLMREDSKGLYVEGTLWVKAERRIEDAIRAHNILRGTGPKGLSIGYSVKEDEYVEFNGGAVRRLLEIELYEVSVVGFGMNPQATVTGVKSMTDDDGNLLSKRDVEKVLRDAGLSRREAKAFIARGYDSIACDGQKGDGANRRDDDQDLSDVLAQLKNLTNTFKG